jgi:hypothetical protein
VSVRVFAQKIGECVKNRVGKIYSECKQYYLIGWEPGRNKTVEEGSSHSHVFVCVFKLV